MKTKNFIVTCRPEATGRAATPACALHSGPPFADAKKTGIVCAQSPRTFDREMTALVFVGPVKIEPKCVGISADRNSSAKRSPAGMQDICLRNRRLGRPARYRRGREIRAGGCSVGVTSASSLAISTTMEKVAYDPQKDLAPIKLVAEVPEAFFKAGTMA